MKAVKSQVLKEFPVMPMPALQDGSNCIIIPATVLTTDEAVTFRDRLTECINCNVATQVAKIKLSTTAVQILWDSLLDAKVKTIEVDLKAIKDFQRLMDCGDSLEKVVLGLMDFYSEADQLNLIISPDALAARPAYTKYTNQFALSLRNSQDQYETVKVSYNREKELLGIFCRKAGIVPIRSNFIQTVLDHLFHSHLLIIPLDRLPQTYHTNFAMLKSQLKSLSGKKISVERDEKDVSIRLLT